MSAKIRFITFLPERYQTDLKVTKPVTLEQVIDIFTELEQQYENRTAKRNLGPLHQKRSNDPKIQGLYFNTRVPINQQIFNPNFSNSQTNNIFPIETSVKNLQRQCQASLRDRECLTTNQGLQSKIIQSNKCFAAKEIDNSLSRQNLITFYGLYTCMPLNTQIELVRKAINLKNVPRI